MVEVKLPPVSGSDAAGGVVLVVAVVFGAFLWLTGRLQAVARVIVDPAATPFVGGAPGPDFQAAPAPRVPDRPKPPDALGTPTTPHDPQVYWGGAGPKFKILIPPGPLAAPGTSAAVADIALGPTCVATLALIYRQMGYPPIEVGSRAQSICSRNGVLR